jgi:hypothetical protein
MTAIDVTVPINNVIANAKTAQGQWVERITTLIGPARAEFRSTYIRWALAINGLHVAADKYRETGWQATHQGFTVSSVRADNTGETRIEAIAEWDGETAANHHLASTPMLLSYGIIDLYACLEEWVFDVYRAYLEVYPDSLLRGDEFRELRRLRSESTNDAVAQTSWAQAWKKRLDDWQRNRIYDGLDKVFLSFCNEARLKRPSKYKHTDIQSWAESLRLIAVVRNSLIHGSETVNAELGALCGKPHSLGFAFKTGDRLSLKLIHLQAIECFTDQLLTAINISLMEHPDAFK